MNTEQVPTSKLVYSNSAEPAQTVTSKSLCIVYEEIHFCLWGHHKELLFFKSPHQEFLSKLRVRPRWATVKLRGRMSLKIFKVRPYNQILHNAFPWRALQPTAACMCSFFHMSMLVHVCLKTERTEKNASLGNKKSGYFDTYCSESANRSSQCWTYPLLLLWLLCDGTCDL